MLLAILIVACQQVHAHPFSPWGRNAGLEKTPVFVNQFHITRQHNGDVEIIEGSMVMFDQPEATRSGHFLPPFSTGLDFPPTHPFPFAPHVDLFDGALATEDGKPPHLPRPELNFPAVPIGRHPEVPADFQVIFDVGQAGHGIPPNFRRPEDFPKIFDAGQSGQGIPPHFRRPDTKFPWEPNGWEKHPEGPDGFPVVVIDKLPGEGTNEFAKHSDQPPHQFLQNLALPTYPFNPGKQPVIKFPKEGDVFRQFPIVQGLPGDIVYELHLTPEDFAPQGDGLEEKDNTVITRPTDIATTNGVLSPPNQHPFPGNSVPQPVNHPFSAERENASGVLATNDRPPLKKFQALENIIPTTPLPHVEPSNQTAASLQPHSVSPKKDRFVRPSSNQPGLFPTTLPAESSAGDVFPRLNNSNTPAGDDLAEDI